MKKIENIFLEFPGYNCFGCSPANEQGLKLYFYLDEATNEAVSHYNPRHHMAGFPGILHGGIQATLMDEVAFWVMFGIYKKMGFTTRMDIRYKAPLNMEGEIEIRGKVAEKTERSVRIKCRLLNEQKQECTEAWVEYIIVSKKLWMRNMGIPAIPESFEKYFQ